MNSLQYLFYKCAIRNGKSNNVKVECQYGPRDRTLRVHEHNRQDSHCATQTDDVKGRRLTAGKEDGEDGDHEQETYQGSYTEQVVHGLVEAAGFGNGGGKVFGRELREISSV